MSPRFPASTFGTRRARFHRPPKRFVYTLETNDEAHETLQTLLKIVPNDMLFYHMVQASVTNELDPIDSLIETIIDTRWMDYDQLFSDLIILGTAIRASLGSDLDALEQMLLKNYTLEDSGYDETLQSFYFTLNPDEAAS